MTYPYIFEICIFEDSDNEYRLYSGVGFADSFAEAARHLEEGWGNSLISIKHLELLEESNFILLPWEVLHNVERDQYWGGRECDSMGVPVEES